MFKNILFLFTKYKLEYYNKTKYTEEDFFGRQTYVVKIPSPAIVPKILTAIGKKGISNVNLEITHSKLPDFKKQAKIQASKNALEKAKYLTENVGAKIGKVVSIVDLENRNLPYASYYEENYDKKEISQSYMNVSNSLDTANSPTVLENFSNLSNIKGNNLNLKYFVQVSYEIE